FAQGYDCHWVPSLRQRVRFVPNPYVSRKVILYEHQNSELLPSRFSWRTVKVRGIHDATAPATRALATRWTDRRNASTTLSCCSHVSCGYMGKERTSAAICSATGKSPDAKPSQA